jgi:6-phosphogluconolactonase
VEAAQQAVADHGYFYAALSGGSTPKALFELMCQPPFQTQVDWSRVHLFWSDERSVPPDHPDSNYRMALEAGLKRMPIPLFQIHRMHAENAIEENAQAYEEEIRATLGSRPFDLIMLGMGDDGHTASLFPRTEALRVTGRLVVANRVPQKETWRMTFTFECINQAHQAVVYVLGASKKQMLATVLRSPDQFELLPAQRVGTPARPALWVADAAAASLLDA